jgi:HEAT repeat protein
MNRLSQEDKTKKAVVVLLAGCLITSPVFAQEIVIEEDYPLISIESFYVREQSQSSDRNKKLESLEFIREAIGRGDKGTEIQTALDKLALEGIINQTWENGRLINYSEIRTQAAIVLGDMGTPEAQDTLIKLILAEYEPMVITEAIQSLTKIGITNKAGRTISQVVDRFDMLLPDNRVAYAALEAFDSLAKKNNGMLDPLVLKTIVRITEGRYSGRVRARANRLLADLKQY